MTTQITGTTRFGQQLRSRFPAGNRYPSWNETGPFTESKDCRPVPARRSGAGLRKIAPRPATWRAPAPPPLNPGTVRPLNSTATSVTLPDVRNLLILFTGAVMASAVLTGCTATGPARSASPSATPTPTYKLPPRPVRPGERPIDAEPVNDGDTRFRVIGLQTGLSGFFGTHAEWQAKGQYVVVRIVVENPGRANSRFLAKRQKLLTADGATYGVDDFAQATKRQPDTLPLGAEVRIEMDLWFDIPKEAKVTAIRLYGDPPLGSRAATDGAEVPLS
jgi:hypothetical protein